MAEKRSMVKSVPFMTLVSSFLIGTLTGYLNNDLTAGILTGIGVGLILMSLLRMIMKASPNQKSGEKTEEHKDGDG